MGCDLVERLRKPRLQNQPATERSEEPMERHQTGAGCEGRTDLSQCVRLVTEEAHGAGQLLLSEFLFSYQCCCDLTGLL